MVAAASPPADRVSPAETPAGSLSEDSSAAAAAADASDEPSLWTWQIPVPVTRRIAEYHSSGAVQDDNLRHPPTLTFTNKPIKVLKPKKKKKKKAAETVEEEIEPKMAKLTIKPKVQAKPAAKTVPKESLLAKSQSPTLSFITIGHVDSGKSTTLGRFLYDTKVISSRQLNTLAKQAKDAGKGSFSLAWVMDQTPEERSRGVTVDTVQCGIEIDGRKLVLVDSPGHLDYLPSVVNGLIGADVAVVIVDSSNDLIFNLATSGASINTREQLLIAKSLGITKVLILVNKLDSPSFEDSQMKFENIVQSIGETLVDPTQFGFDKSFVEFVPISGLLGDNIVSESTNMPWYEGKTMLGVLESWYDDQINTNITILEDDPFVYNITDVINNSNDNTISNKVKDNEVITFGRVHSGFVQQGQTVVDSWGGERGVVDQIWSQQSISKGSEVKVDERVSEKFAIKGDFIEMKLKKVSTPANITIGDILSLESPTLLSQTFNHFILDLVTFDIERPLLVGSPIVIFRGGRSYDAQVSSVEYVVVKSTTNVGKLVKKKNRSHIGSNQRARIRINVNMGMGIVLQNNKVDIMGKLNRIVLRKDSKTIAGGQIVDVIFEQQQDEDVTL